MAGLSVLDLGDLLLGVALLFASLIVIFELAERRRESRRERFLLDQIEAEYQLYSRLGRL
ncbi:MAG TPA: hypothetical protein VHZ55_34175 [Bryobacteraceae bacterium]|jgi:hypothetical protein|nr:hypothetical protein [Bryobacteraceae bacterium]